MPRLVEVRAAAAVRRAYSIVFMLCSLLRVLSKKVVVGALCYIYIRWWWLVYMYSRVCFCDKREAASAQPLKMVPRLCVADWGGGEEMRCCCNIG